jgi:hypothetical protein
VHPEFYDPSGVSVILINTAKGKRFFEQMAGEFEIIESELDNLPHNMLKRPAIRHPLRDVVYQDIKNYEIDIFEESYLKT